MKNCLPIHGLSEAFCRAMVCAFLLLVSVISSPASGGSFKPFLAFSEILHSQRSRIADVFGLTFQEPYLYTFVDMKPFYFRTKYRDNVSDPLLAFSANTIDSADSETIPFKTDEASAPRYITLLPRLPHGYLLIDARLKAHAFDKKDKLFRSTSFVVDLIKPPADSRGEPTWQETGGLRHRIRQELAKLSLNEVIIAGAVERPKDFPDSDGAQYFAATRLNGFSVVTIKCDKTDWANCHFARSCNLSGTFPIQADQIAGIAVSQKRKLVLIADISVNRLLVYQFNSCISMVQLGAIHLPEEICEVRGVFIDPADRLWVATSAYDNFKNSSVYVWPADKW